MLNADERRTKLEEGTITLQDLSGDIHKNAVPNAKVYILKINRWTRVGEYQLLVKQTCNNLEDAWINVVVRANRPVFNWLLLPIARIIGSVVEVGNWNVIPNTNLRLDFFYIGDGTEGTPIVFETK